MKYLSDPEDTYRLDLQSQSLLLPARSPLEPTQGNPGPHDPCFRLDPLKRGVLHIQVVVLVKEQGASSLQIEVHTARAITAATSAISASPHNGAKNPRPPRRAGGDAAAKKFAHNDPGSGLKCKQEVLPTKMGVDFAHTFNTDVRLLRFLAALPEPTESHASARQFQERVARTPEERACYDNLRADTWGPRVRLEQERLGWAAAMEALMQVLRHSQSHVDT